MNTNPQKPSQHTEDEDLEAFRTAMERKTGKRIHGDSLPDTSAVKKKKKKKLLIIVPSVIVVILIGFYCLTAFTNIPMFRDLRSLWISTALSTGKHHWLANIFPQSEIDRVQAEIDAVFKQDDIAGGTDNLKDKNTNDPTEKRERPKDILGQRDLSVGDKDYAGYTVVVNDVEEGIVISEITGSGNCGFPYSFNGKVALVDDPSRVYIGTTPDEQKGQLGLRIKEMMKLHGAILGVNASGFIDPAGEGLGGDIVGLCYYDGNSWGYPVNYYGSVVLTTDNKLVVGHIDDWSKYNIRDGIQFGPVLIADGKEVIDESSGSTLGLHPRTAIGQRADGVIVFIDVDGRGAGGSAGCLISDLTKILLEYNVVNAACCDGGASCVIAYDGEIVTHNCSENPNYGRLLPNAWLVRPKADS